MNRAERRKKEKVGIPKDIILNQYRNEAYEKGYQDGMRKVIEINFYMIAYTLQYKLDYNAEQLQEIMKAIYNNIDAYRTDHLSKEDYNTIVDEMRNVYKVKLN